MRAGRPSGRGAALLTVLVTATTAFAQGGPPVVRSVELRLPQNADPTEYVKLVSVAPGVPLSRNAVRRTIERLYQKGTVAEVVALAVPLGPGEIAVAFEVTLKRYFSSLAVVGARNMSEAAVRRAAGFKEREEYYPEGVKLACARVLEAYRRIGYAAAQVEPEVTEEGSDWRLTLLVTEGPPTRITALFAAGDPAMGAAAFARALGVTAGDVLNLDTLDSGIEGLRRKYREERRYRARVDPPRVRVDGLGATVTVPVRAGPSIRFHFHGSRGLDEHELLSRLDYDAQEPLDDLASKRLARRLAEFYRALGYFDVVVHTHEYASPDGDQAVVAFHVIEGRRLTVTSIDFEGITYFSTSTLREVVNGALQDAEPEEGLVARVSGGPGQELGSAEVHGRQPEGHLEPDTQSALVEAAYAEAAERVAARYRRAGFLQVAITATRVSIDDVSGTAKVVLAVDEGVQTLVKSVQVTGAPDGERLAALTRLTAGQPLSSVDVESGRLALLQEFQRRGHLYARVDDDAAFTKDGTWADVLYRCAPGPQVRVNRILIREEGQELRDRVRASAARTDESVVRQSLALAEGDVFDPDAVERSQRSLLKLGVFSSVTLRPSPPEGEDPVKDLIVDVKERKAIAFELLPGFSLADGPRVQASASHVNAFGRALDASAKLKANYFNASYPVWVDPSRAQPAVLDSIGGRLNLSLSAPRLLQIFTVSPLDVSGRVDGVVEQVLRPTYNFTRVAAIAGGEWAVVPKLVNVGLQYEVERDYIRAAPNVRAALDELARADVERLRFDDGYTLLESVRATVSLDKRDDPANPKRGVLVGLSGEFSHGSYTTLDRGDFPVLLTKVSGTLSGFVQMRPGVTVAVAARGGGIIPVGNSVIVPTKRFFLGGAGSIRGFKEDGLIPEDRRRKIRGQLEQCRALANPLGCSPTAQRLADGREVPSEGGQLFTNGRVELRIALSGELEASVFVDGGNLWLDPATFDPLALRGGAGVGLRVITPIGPVEVAAAAKMGADVALNETLVEPHFSIGVF